MLEADLARRIDAYCLYLFNTARALGAQVFYREEVQNTFRNTYGLEANQDVADAIASSIIVEIQNKQIHPVYLGQVIAMFIDPLFGFDTFTKCQRPKVQQLRGMIARYLVNNFLSELHVEFPFQRLALTVIGADTYVDFQDMQTGKINLEQVRRSLTDLQKL